MKIKNNIKNCCDCNIPPEWGSGFLFCPQCKKESEMNKKKGQAVRNWNNINKLKDKK